MHTTLTFDRVERRADRTLAIVLLARRASNMMSLVVWFAVLNSCLKSLLKSLATDKELGSISDTQAEELNKTLQEIYSMLERILRRKCVIEWQRIPVLGTSIRHAEDHAEDLGDIIEDLAFSGNQDFRSMIAECAKSIRAADTKAHSAELIGRM